MVEERKASESPLYETGGDKAHAREKTSGTQSSRGDDQMSIWKHEKTKERNDQMPRSPAHGPEPIQDVSDQDDGFTKISANLPNATIESLRTTAGKLGISMTEVLRRSIGLLKFLIEEEAEGGKILIRDRNGDVQRIRIL